MPSSLPFADYGEAIGDAASVLRNNAAAAGLTAAVPTCPGWTVRDLVLHQGLVHRWATQIVSGIPIGQVRPEAEVLAEGQAAPDLLDWFDNGLVDLLNTLARAPEDLQAFFFLKDAPPPRLAWARRQAHEVSIHAVDAMAARLGRAPATAQVWVRPSLAADGIDELLTGFLPRRTTQLRSPDPLTVLVRAEDVGTSWRLHIGTGPVRTTVGDPPDAADAIDATGSASPDVVLAGTAKGLYLALWNRGGDVVETGGRDFLALWRDRQRVSW